MARDADTLELAGELAPELAAALAAVRAASDVCRGAQGRLLTGHTLTKGDASPVTIADFAAQAVVCAELTDSLGAIAMIGEEDSDDLRAPAATGRSIRSTAPRASCAASSTRSRWR